MDRNIRQDRFVFLIESLDSSVWEIENKGKDSVLIYASKYGIQSGPKLVYGSPHEFDGNDDEEHH
jgi:hypothetical protein